jgi:hypothetical protein
LTVSRLVRRAQKLHKLAHHATKPLQSSTKDHARNLVPQRRMNPDQLVHLARLAAQDAHPPPLARSARIPNTFLSPKRVPPLVKLVTLVANPAQSESIHAHLAQHHYSLTQPPPLVDLSVLLALMEIPSTQPANHASLLAPPAPEVSAPIV